MVFAILPVCVQRTGRPHVRLEPAAIGFGQLLFLNPCIFTLEPSLPVYLPKLSDSVDSHIGPLGSAIPWAAAIFSPAVSTAATTAQILPESPGRQGPTTETAAAAGEEVIETPGALTKPGCLLRRPMGRQTPAGPSAKTKIRIAQFRDLLNRYVLKLQPARARAITGGDSR